MRLAMMGGSGGVPRSSPTFAGVGAPADVVFQSDWPTTGTSEAVFRDGGRWEGFLSMDDDCEVATNSSLGLDFPSTNVLVVRSPGDSKILRTESLPVPDVGESLYYRWYFRNDSPVGSRDKTHPVQDGNAIGDCNWYTHVRRDEGSDDDHYRVGLGVGSNAVEYGRSLDWEIGVTYRWEVRIHRIGTSTYNMHARVYDVNDSLLADDDDFVLQGDSETLADTPTLTFNDVANLDGLNAGLNGYSGIEGVTIYGYQGGFCVRTEDWCGAYNASGVDSRSPS